MRFDRIGKFAVMVVHTGVLVGFLFAAGCSEARSGNKTDDPALKEYMDKTREAFKTKMQGMKNQNHQKKGTAGASHRP